MSTEPRPNLLYRFFSIPAIVFLDLNLTGAHLWNIAVDPPARVSVRHKHIIDCLMPGREEEDESNVS